MTYLAGKPLGLIFRDLVDVWRHPRRTIDDYFASDHHQRIVKDPLDYIGWRQWTRLMELTTNPALSEVFNNKLETQSFLTGLGVPMPPLVGSYLDGRAQIGDEQFGTIKSVGDAVRLASALLDHCGGPVFAKPTNGSGGRGGFALTETTPPEKLLLAVRDRDYIFQEKVVQHEALAVLNPTSLNTLRLLTGLMRDGTVVVGPALLRMGRKGGETDAFRAGNPAVRVDLASGRLGKLGFHLEGHRVEPIYAHPDSEVAFAGRAVPFIQQMIDVVSKTAPAVGNRLIGWDIAVAENGMLVTEINQKPDIVFGELIHGPLSQHAPMAGFIREITDGRGL